MIIKTSGIFFFCGAIIFAFLPVIFDGVCVVRPILGCYFLLVPLFYINEAPSLLEILFAVILPLLHLIAIVYFINKKYRVYATCLSGIITWHIAMFLLFINPAKTLLISTVFFVGARISISAFENRKIQQFEPQIH